MTRGAADEPHHEVQAVLDALEEMGAPSLEEFSPLEARDLLDGLLGRDEPSIQIASVQERTIDGPGGDLPVRIYDPRPDESRPVVCYLHGGGWTIGSLDSHDPSCRKLAAETGYVVVGVDYRLAPEHPFPAALEDSYAALEWLADEAAAIGGDPDRIVLAGDSAGGNLAAATALLARHRDGPSIAYQLLLYPVTGDPTETDSYEENAEGYFLTTAEMEWFRDHYLERDVDELHLLVAPRLARDLSGLPPATVVTAGFDPLREDGAAYADRLEAAGVPVTYRNYPDVIHGFMAMLEEPVDLTRAHEAYADVAADLADALE